MDTTDTRPYRAGMKYAEGIISFTNLFYQRLTAIRFMKGLIDSLQGDLDKKEKEYAQKIPRRRR